MMQDRPFEDVHNLLQKATLMRDPIQFLHHFDKALCLCKMEIAAMNSSKLRGRVIYIQPLPTVQDTYGKSLTL